MSSMKDYHNRAMELTELAFIHKIKGEIDSSEKHFIDALRNELHAIEIMESSGVIEPTYSVLLRSAATLALDCGDHRHSEKLIAKALSNEPPLEIAEELRDLLEQVNLRRHLKLRGITLEDDELQMNLTGKGVGFGLVKSDEFLKRVDNASKMLYRIVERRGEKPFREKGRIPKGLKDNYEIFLSVPRAASFSVTLKVGVPSNQKLIPGFENTSDVVDEFMNLISLVNQDKISELKEIIQDDSYCRNFLALAKNIAPDGENIKQVGFTSMRNGQEKYTEITKPRSSIPAISALKNEKIEKIELKGILKFADATHGESGVIKIIDAENQHHKINVPEGMMSDIVKPMWDSYVLLKGNLQNKTIELTDIEEVVE